MTAPLEVAFEQLLTNWDGVCDANKVSVGPGWDLAQHGLTLQIEALQEIQRAAFFDPAQEKAFVLAGVHSARLLASAFALIIRGYFDVALYLARPGKDAESLILGTGRDPNFAQRILADDEDHLAAEARRELIRWFRDANIDEAAGALEQRFREDARAGNGAAHTRAQHLYRVVNGDIATSPSISGLENEGQAVALWASFLEVLDWTLRWISLIGDDVLSDGWKVRYKDFDDREGEYRNTYGAQQNDDARADV